MPLTQEQALKLEEHEGFRPRVYKCTAGFDTIGIGYNLFTNMLNLPKADINAFYNVGITHEKAIQLLKLCCNKIEVELERNIAFYDKLDSNTKYVLIDLAYNMGVAGLLGFKKTLAYIEQGQYAKASAELLNSKWAKQVDKNLSDDKGRANNLANILKTGKLR